MIDTTQQGKVSSYTLTNASQVNSQIKLPRYFVAAFRLSLPADTFDAVLPGFLYILCTSTAGRSAL